MTFRMAEETKVPLPPPQIITPAFSQEKKRFESKHLIWAITAVTIVLLIVVGFSMGGYFFTKTTKDIVEQYPWRFPIKEGGEMEGTVENDVKENTQLFHMHSPEGMMVVLKDYNRDIEVTKYTIGERVVCFVEPMNVSEELTPMDMDLQRQNSLENTQHEMPPSDGSESHPIYDLAFIRPISDPSFLGPKVQELCDSGDTYWLPSTCDVAKEVNDHSRRKRSACIYIYICHWYCIRLLSVCIG